MKVEVTEAGPKVFQPKKLVAFIDTAEEQANVVHALSRIKNSYGEGTPAHMFASQLLEGLVKS